MQKIIFVLTFFLMSGCIQKNKEQTTSPSKNNPDIITDKFSLEDLKHRTFLYFWELAEPGNGQIPDRWPTKSFSSIAAKGFGLAAYIDGVENNYITREEAAGRVLKTLKFYDKLAQGHTAKGIGGYKGFFYHFLDMKTGERFEEVELSTIDTGWLMAGILCCQSYFERNNETETEIREIADKLFRRVEWDWAMNGKDAMSMGWHPESGFIESYWYGYNEAMLLVLLAIGSPSHPIPAAAWDSWTSKYLWAEWYGLEHLNFGPLFGHQYSHMFIDFRGIYDEYMKVKGIDYFENSRRATLAQQAFGADNPGAFKDYTSEIWGLTACDGPGTVEKIWNGKQILFEGYSARGSASDYLVDDGTIAPTAAGGSIPFAPEICLPALEYMFKKYGRVLYQEYGFKDAFNPTFTWGNGNENGWFDVDYIGIDQGPIVIMLENYESGLIWDIMKKNQYIIAGLKKAGFTGGWLDKPKG